MKLKIHPLFFLLALVLIALGQALVFLSVFLAVLLHEFAHAIIARSRGYYLNEVVLLPYGAVLYGQEKIERCSSVLIALAGPACNAFLALVTLGLWWLFPALYPYTQPFFTANLIIGGFNLLPAFPLDGARVVLGCAKNKAKALKLLKLFGLVLSFVLLALFVVSFFFQLNFTLGIMAVFLFLGATYGTDREMYHHVAKLYTKGFSEGVVLREVMLLESATLLKVLKLIKPEFITVFIVVDEKGRRICTVDEERMKKLFENFPLNKQLRETLKNANTLR